MVGCSIGSISVGMAWFWAWSYGLSWAMLRVLLRELSLFFNSSGIAVVLLVLMGCVTCGVNDELLPYDQFCI